MNRQWLTYWPQITVLHRLTLSLEHKKHRRQHTTMVTNKHENQIEYDQSFSASQAQGHQVFVIQYTWWFSYHHRLDKNIKAVVTSFCHGTRNNIGLDWLPEALQGGILGHRPQAPFPDRQHTKTWHFEHHRQL